MAYFKNRIKKDVASFNFTTDSYAISNEIYTQYHLLKKLYHVATTNITTHKHDSSNASQLISKLKSVLEFYDSAKIYITMLIEEIFKNPLMKKRELLVLLNKMFRMFVVFDIFRYQNPKIFHDFSVVKDKYRDRDCPLIKRITVFSAISLPMAHLFMSYFRLDNDEIHVPAELIKRGVIFLSDAKKEHLYFLGCLVCKYDDFLYCRVFFCGLYNRFFQSGYFIKYIDILNEQQQAYYVALAEYM